MLHIPALLNTETLAQVRAIMARAPWVDGRATAGHASMRVKRNRQLGERSAEAAQAGALIATALDANPAFILAALPARIVPPLFNLYADGEHYGAYIDGAIRPTPAGPIRTDLSAKLFLSDPETYGGGELCIRDGSGVNQVKLAAGDLILYLAGTTHHVEPVTAGARLASFFWVQSLVRDATRRTMLHELDEAIQGLAADHPEHPTLVALHSHYHNLLRQWAEV